MMKLTDCRDESWCKSIIAESEEDTSLDDKKTRWINAYNLRFNCFARQRKNNGNFKLLIFGEIVDTHLSHATVSDQQKLE
jgi:hypothetical protein